MARPSRGDSGNIALAECDEIVVGRKPDGLARLERVINLGYVHAVRAVADNAA